MEHAIAFYQSPYCCTLTSNVARTLRTPLAADAKNSHVVTSLKFGTQFPARGRKAHSPDVQLEGLAALEDQKYLVDTLHTAPHHYIKVRFVFSFLISLLFCFVLF